MLAGTLVTIAGFVPVGFAASSAGEYTFSLFAVVSIALIVSWLVAVVFAPLLGVVILGRQRRRMNRTPAVCFALSRLPVIACKVADDRALAGAVRRINLALPLIPRQFFPSSDRPEFLVDISLPQNASIYASETVARRFDAFLKGEPDVDRWSTYVGRGAIRFYLPLDVQLPNYFFTQAVIVAKDVPARERLRENSIKFWPTISQVRSPASIRWSLGRRSAGPCNIASAVPIAARFGRLHSSWRRSSHPIPRPEISISTGSSRRGRCAFVSIRMRRAF